MKPLTTPVIFSLPFHFQKFPARFASIGSCFSEKAVSLLKNAGFTCCSNPNGIVYNPVSIKESLRRITGDIPYTEEDFFCFNGLYHSFDHHGCFSKPVLEDAVSAAENARKEFRDFLKMPCPVAITFGTAVVFRREKNKKIAANCHKLPGHEFSRELLSLEKCLADATDMAEMIFKTGDHPLLLTVSPVRHHPGDPVLNTRSKSILIETCHRLTERFPGKCAYFPAFELLHDELRDYRFYDTDMIHPSQVAEEYILETFIRKCYPETAEKILAEAYKNIKRNSHIPGGVK